MRKIEKFVAEDGSEFTTEQACVEYEDLLNKNQYFLNKIFNDKEVKIQDLFAWGISTFIIGAKKSIEKNERDSQKKQIQSIIGKEATFMQDLKGMKQKELRELLNTLNQNQEFEKSKIVFEEMESRKKK